MRMGKNIWHCMRINKDDSDIKVYDSPKLYRLRFGYLNLQPASGYTNTVLFGEKIDKRWILLANQKAFQGVFHEGDLLYVDDNTPNISDEDYVNGDGANAIVDSVREQNLVIRIVLKKAEF